MHVFVPDKIEEQHQANENKSLSQTPSSHPSETATLPVSFLSDELQKKLLQNAAFNLSKQWNIPSQVKPISESDKAFLRSNTLQSIMPQQQSNDIAVQMINSIATGVITAAAINAIKSQGAPQPLSSDSSTPDPVSPELSIAQGTLIASAGVEFADTISDAPLGILSSTYPTPAPEPTSTGSPLSTPIVESSNAQMASNSTSTTLINNISGSPCDLNGAFRQALNGCVEGIVLRPIPPTLPNLARGCIIGAGAQVITHEAGCVIESVLGDSPTPTPNPTVSNRP